MSDFSAEKVTELIAAYAEYLDKQIARAKPRPGDESAPDPLWLLDRAMEALSSLRDAAEDAEPEWEYGTSWLGSPDPDDRLYELSGNAADAAGDLAELNRAYPYPEENFIVRRIPAGPWLPVPEGNQ